MNNHARKWDFLKRGYAFLIVGIVFAALAAAGYQLYRSERTEPPVPAGTFYTSDAISFRYPKGFTVTSFEEAGGTVILAQDLSATSGQAGFQIFISPFDEPGPITEERIRQDLPDMKIENANAWRRKRLEIGTPPESRSLEASSDLLGLSFNSFNAAGEPTFEIWFAYGDRLYQMTALAGFRGQLLEVAQSLTIPITDDTN